MHLGNDQHPKPTKTPVEVNTTSRTEVALDGSPPLCSLAAASCAPRLCGLASVKHSEMLAPVALMFPCQRPSHAPAVLRSFTHFDRARPWRGTTPTAAESCPAQLPHCLSWASTGGPAGQATSMRGICPRPSLCSSPAQGPTGREGGRRGPS